MFRLNPATFISPVTNSGDDNRVGSELCLPPVEDNGKGDWDQSEDSAGGAIYKIPLPRVNSVLVQLPSFMGRKSLKETTLRIKNHLARKKARVQPPGYRNSLVQDLLRSSCGTYAHIMAMTE